MPRSLSDRLAVDPDTAEAFAASIERFGNGLPAAERAILDALLQAAMDPWSRSLLQPGGVTAEQAAALDRIVAAREDGTQGDGE